LNSCCRPKTSRAARSTEPADYAPLRPFAGRRQNR
jgi:hypothetical protein